MDSSNRLELAENVILSTRANILIETLMESTAMELNGLLKEHHLIKTVSHRARAH